MLAATRASQSCYTSNLTLPRQASEVNLWEFVSLMGRELCSPAPTHQIFLTSLRTHPIFNQKIKYKVRHTATHPQNINYAIIMEFEFREAMVINHYGFLWEDYMELL